VLRQHLLLLLKSKWLVWDQGWVLFVLMNLGHIDSILLSLWNRPSFLVWDMKSLSSVVLLGFWKLLWFLRISRDSLDIMTAVCSRFSWNLMLRSFGRSNITWNVALLSTSFTHLISSGYLRVI